MKKLILIFCLLIPLVAWGQSGRVHDYNPTTRKIFDVVDYGADNTGVVDATDEINAACDAAYAASGIVKGAGTFLISSSIKIRSDADFTGATFNFNDIDGTAVIWADSTTNLFSKTVVFPVVKNTVEVAEDGLWNDASIGIKIINGNICKFYIPHIQYFQTGLLVTTYGSHGSAYNEFNLGLIQGCKRTVVLSPADANGWVNENLFYNGRLLLSGSDAGATGTRGILLDSLAHSPNNNIFIKFALESNTIYDIECFGTYNSFMFGRYENASPAIHWGQNHDLVNIAAHNVVYRGYNISAITYTIDASCTYNGYDNGWQMFYNGASPYVGSNVSSDASPVFVAIDNSDRDASGQATNYGFAAGAGVVIGKAVGDAGPRWEFTNGDGYLYWGNGGGTLTLNIHREGSGVLHIADALHLTPLADPPGTATEGTIYMDTDHHLYVHNGSTWVQLDN